jgi:hypothetical protein
MDYTQTLLGKAKALRGVPEAELQGRLLCAQVLMDYAALDGLLVTTQEDFFYLLVCSRASRGSITS